MSVLTIKQLERVVIIRKGSQNDTERDVPVQEVDGDSVWRNNISRSTDKGFASVGGQNHCRRHGGLEEGVEVGETLDIEHVNLVDEDDSWNDLRNALVNIALDDFVHLPAKFIGDFCPAALDETAHDAHNILTALWSGVCGVKITKGDVLNEFLALVNIALRQRDIGFGLEVVRRCIGIRATDTFDGASVCLDVDDVANDDFFLEDGLVDAGVQAKLLRAFCSLETDDNVGDGFSVATERVFGLGWGQFCDLSLVDLFCFLYSKALREACLMREETTGGGHAPIARRNTSARTSVFFTSVL